MLKTWMRKLFDLTSTEIWVSSGGRNQDESALVQKSCCLHCHRYQPGISSLHTALSGKRFSSRLVVDFCRTFSMLLALESPNIRVVEAKHEKPMEKQGRIYRSSPQKPSKTPGFSDGQHLLISRFCSIGFQVAKTQTLVFPMFFPCFP